MLESYFCYHWKWYFISDVISSFQIACVLWIFINSFCEKFPRTQSTHLRLVFISLQKLTAILMSERMSTQNTTCCNKTGGNWLCCTHMDFILISCALYPMKNMLNFQLSHILFVFNFMVHNKIFIVNQIIIPN